MAKNGADYLVLVNTGTTESPTYTLVGEQRDLNIEKSTGTIDASHKANKDQILLGGRNTAQLTLNACDVPTDTGQAALHTAQENRTPILIIEQITGSTVKKAEFLITNISKAAPDQDVATLAITAERTGSWLPLS